MNIALVEPFFSGSHRQWAEGYQAFSQHKISLLTLPGRYWKWRMHGAAHTLARQCLEQNLYPDLFLVSDMLDLTTFIALLHKTHPQVPFALYFHENQITYPWSPDDRDVPLHRDNHYGFINFSSAASADALFFNSHFHQKDFFDQLPVFLNQFPDFQELEAVPSLREKSNVLHLGLDLTPLRSIEVSNTPSEAVILWNHRWEYDKDPELFFRILLQLKAEGLPFKLIVLGAAYRKVPAIFETAKKELADRIIHFGYAMDRGEYARLLHLADILPVTSRQDFFGASVVEAIFCHCYPLLPDRLAFPEHIPESIRKIHLYHTDQELLDRLRQLITHIHLVRKSGFSGDFVARYDWRKLALAYDNTFASIVQSF